VPRSGEGDIVHIHTRGEKKKKGEKQAKRIIHGKGGDGLIFEGVEKMALNEKRGAGRAAKSLETFHLKFQKKEAVATWGKRIVHGGKERSC